MLRKNKNLFPKFYINQINSVNILQYNTYIEFFLYVNIDTSIMNVMFI